MDTCYSSITFVAKYWRREIGFACSKKVNIIIPRQAEVKAIKWTLSLATNLEFEAVIIKSDSQHCANHPPPPHSAWRIKPVCADPQVLLTLSPKVSICRLPSLFKVASNFLAKWSLTCNLFGSFDIGNSLRSFDSIVLG